MKRFFTIVAVLLIAALAFVGCSKQETDSSVLTIGATPEPHASMLNLVVEDLAKEGITLKVVEFTDYNIPNEALESGQLDANFFQHIPYMEESIAKNGYHLSNAAGIHIEPIAIYSSKIKSLDDLENGAKIAIPNDPTNEGRALLLLQSAGLIKLSDKAGITATPLDVVDNPKKLEFVEIDAASLPRVLADVDAAVINGNYAIPAGLSAKNDGLFVEGADSPYVNIITVKEGNENDPRIVALVNALKSDKIKDYINKTYPNGEVVLVF